jgi:hypothetical protein
MWNKWLVGLINAGISAGASAITVSIVDPENFNFSTGIYKLGTVVGVTAIVSMAKYLVQNPLPGGTTVTTVTQTVTPEQTETKVTQTDTKVEEKK